MNHSFKDKVAVVTGAGGGIGRALALQLGAAGARLALSDIDPAGLTETIRQLPLSTEVRGYALMSPREKGSCARRRRAQRRSAPRTTFSTTPVSP